MLDQTSSAVLPINWKNSIDNYLEGYHIPVGHPGLLRLLDYKRYLVETSDARVSIARSPMRDKASARLAGTALPAAHAADAGPARARAQ